MSEKRTFSLLIQDTLKWSTNGFSLSLFPCEIFPTSNQITDQKAQYWEGKQNENSIR